MWLYIPRDATFTASASAPAPPPSTSPYPSQFPAFVQSCTWRGKSSPSRIWLKRLRRAHYMQRLFGAMPEASQADDFVVAWTSFLRASRASRTATPGSSSAPPTTATSGPPCAASSSSAGRGPSSSRTSAGCSATPPSTAYSEAFGGWVSRLREDYSRRQKSARPRSGNAFSSLRSRKASDPESLALFPLDQWPTPTERDHRSIHASTSTLNANSRPLSEAAGLWATPKATEAGPDLAKLERSSTGLALPAQASLWATPTVADTEGGRLSRSGDRKGELLLHGQARAQRGRRVLLTTPPGGNSSRFGLTLNPWFVERLMGWPTGWTACDFSETALSHWRRRMRSELSRLGWPPALPVQLDFFG